MERVTLGKVDTQLAVAYAVYMMVGSYFAGTHCVNQLEENHLFLHYRELNPDKQVRFETRAEEVFLERYADRVEEFSHYRCDVRFRHKDDIYIIQFYTGVVNIEMTVNRKGIIKMEQRMRDDA